MVGGWLQIVIVVLGRWVGVWVGRYGLVLVWAGQVWLLGFAGCLCFMGLLDCRFGFCSFSFGLFWSGSWFPLVGSRVVCVRCCADKLGFYLSVVC